MMSLILFLIHALLSGPHTITDGSNTIEVNEGIVTINNDVSYRNASAYSVGSTVYLTSSMGNIIATINDGKIIVPPKKGRAK